MSEVEEIEDVPLLPCPFCGCTRVIRKVVEQRCVGAWCLGCNATGPLVRIDRRGATPSGGPERRAWYAAEERAAAACAERWNTRQPTPAPSPATAPATRRD